MKIRTGFVSNSSSSSYIIAGFKVDTVKYKNMDDKKIESLYNNFTVLYGSEGDLEGDAIVIGKRLVYSDECGLEAKNFSVEEILKKIKEVEQELIQLEIPIISEGRIWTGVRSC